MRQYFKYIFIFFFLLNSFSVLANKFDSLLNLIQTPKSELSKADALGELGWQLIYVNPDSSILLCEQAIKILEHLLIQKPNHFKTKKSQAMTYSVKGMAYLAKSNYLNALQNLLMALKIDEAINNKQGVATRLGNIGTVYAEEENYAKALEYYFKALKIAEEMKNNLGIAAHLSNIGNVYSFQADYQKTLSYYFKALAMNEKLGDKNGIANNLGNIGVVYKLMGDIEKGLEYYLKALKINEELGSKSNIIINLGNIGRLYTQIKNFELSQKYLQRTLDMASEIGSLDDIMTVNESLHDLYRDMGNFKQAFEYYKNYILIRDSILNDKNIKDQTRLEMQYEFDKQQTTDSIKNVEKAKQETLKHNQEIKQQKIYTYGGIIGFSLMLVVAVVSFRAFRNKQKANTIIANQKLLVEAKQKEILDSIHYAKRIQQALLPSQKLIARTISTLKNKL